VERIVLRELFTSYNERRQNMKTFVIFDRKTGEILQTHMQTDELHKSPQELLKTVRPEAEGVAVDVMEVEILAPGTSYRVDVRGKKLLPVERSKTRGAGGAFVQPAGGDPLRARTVVFDVGQREQKK
jgi:hypothetical protein